jgi:hypothetical protein
MMLIKILRDCGHYQRNNQVRVDDDKGKLLVSGGYAVEIKAEETKMMPVLENKAVEAIEPEKWVDPSSELVGKSKKKKGKK